MRLLFKMTPAGAFYNGSQFNSLDFPFPKSDTVFQAIRKTWELLWGEDSVEELLKKYREAQNVDDIPFTLSSIFPVVEDIYFLPRPFSLSIESHDNNRPWNQQNGIISWVSASVYADWLQGQKPSGSLDFVLSPGLYFHPQDYKTVKLLKEKTLWSCDEGRIRNSVDRITAEAVAYPANQIFYAEQLEWYILISVQNEYQSKLESVFRLLADEGIGGKRGVGCGGFIYHPPVALPETLRFMDEPIKDSFVTLSLYYPAMEDVQKGILDKAEFQLMERQGWFQDNQGCPRRQKKLRLCCEGSHFSFSEIPKKSLMAVGTEETRCYHYVYPFRIPAPGVNL